MKKVLKIILYLLGGILGLIILVVLIAALWISISGNIAAKKSIKLAGPEVQTITFDGFTFRDLNKNGKLADIARQEYTAVGIRIALHPMVDLATEPRWGRINGTFGEDATLVSKLGYAYIKGFQGDSLGSAIVACMTKHFSGGGPQKEGIDPHFPIAKGQIYPGNNFDYHLIPFEAALKAGTAEIMPYYGIPMDQTSENVGFSFNKEMITGLLRSKLMW
ncbi:MAG: glycoside hydrolase family 3 N-terminal domain-containing protein [Bacteroidales bacterium]|nr:glycoside hydrolase family 3 N-terminal domain-containing protein [Bacteroidales bacterium]